MYLAPVLRLADSADRSQGQRIEALQCMLKGNEVVIQLTSSEDVDLEVWAMERAAEYFRQGVWKRRSRSRPLTDCDRPDSQGCDRRAFD